MRRRASRRSVSSCDSPGPRVPTPPPRRSRCCHMPRMRGRLYSSCASSTWSLPSALDGVLGEDVEDQLRAVDDARLERVLERAAAGAGRARRRRAATSASASLVRLLQLLELALADVGARVGARRGAGRARRRARRRRCARALELGELVVRVDALREHGEDEPALGLGARRGIGLALPSSRRDYAASCQMPRMPDSRRRGRSSSSTSRRRAATRRALAALRRASRVPRSSALYDDGDGALLRAATPAAAARPARRAPRHGAGAGQPARPDRGRRRARPRRERHEGRRSR